MADPLIFRDVQSDYPDFLHDESRRAGLAESISFPTGEDEARNTLALMSGRGTPVTTQGARTGITGGAVPDGGHLLNLSRMSGILDWRDHGSDKTVVVQPGMALSGLREAIARQLGPAWFFPPDPTEASASLGGMIACNASGACSFDYGPTRRYVQRLKVVLPDGSMLELMRNRETARELKFELRSDSGRRLTGVLPAYQMPYTKSAAGYFVKPSMDLIDLFIGAEGTLGVVTEAELLLIPAPRAQFAALAFLPRESNALELVHSISRRAGSARLVALEYFDGFALSLVRSETSRYGVDIPAGSGAAVYLEWHCDGPKGEDEAVTNLAEAVARSGGSLDAVSVASAEKEMQRLKDFRHSVPESVNRLIAERKKTAPGITKLGTDLAVPGAYLDEILALYRQDLDAEGLDYVIFGHIGDNHLHVNILPETEEEYELGRALHLGWAARVVELGGTVSAEHGIGKLKRDLLLEMYGADGIEEMKRLKQAFDPQFLLNRGNLFVP